DGGSGGNSFATLFSKAPAIDSTGKLTFQLNPNVTGTASLNVTAANGTLVSAVKQTTLTIVATNPPTFTLGPNERAAENASAQTFTNWATSIQSDPTANTGQVAFTVTGDATAATLFSVQPAISPADTLTFTPAAGQFGVSTITVVLTNTSTGLSSTAHTFTIAVVAPPVGRAETYEVNNYPGSSTADNSSNSVLGVLANDSDPNAGGVMTAALAAAPSFGGITLNSNGTFTYTPNSSFQGIDRFSYQPVDSPATGGTVTDTLYSHNGALVNKLYQEVLNRAADDAAIKTYAPQLDATTLTMSALAGTVITSTEHLNTVVNNLYLQFLGVPADPNGQAYWVGVWRTYGGPEQVIIGLATSSACYTYAGGTNTLWVTLLYNQIHNRAPDSGGLNYWVGQLQSGAMTQQQVVSAFLATNTYRDIVITSYYNQYLGRPPSTGSSSDMSYWEGQLAAGVTQLSMQETLVGSAEYLGNPAAPATKYVLRLTS
ncbi:MAG TPA: DUF4214 domain-containing protein, partial [Pirellulales bacterium]|nr:DUF4214 domain-containing protein [Pirellulales bacterium]